MGDSSNQLKESSPSSALEDLTYYRNLKLPHDATLAQLKEATKACLKLIEDTNQCSDDRKWLVRHLVELRLRIQLLEDGDEESPKKTPSVALTLGHHFELERTSSKKLLCDHCCSSVWTVVQEFHRCSICHFVCHRRCLDRLITVCPHVTVTDRGGLEMSICPMIGLGAQRYKCAECRTRIVFPARLCDYTGLHYCAACHRMDACAIPARVVRNWDWRARCVSRSSLRLLRYAAELPLIGVERINDRLFTLVPELGMAQKIRHDLKSIIRYLKECQSGRTLIKGDVLRLGETPKLYSMEHLELAKRGCLERKLSVVVDKCREHIGKCHACSGRGYLCELCGADEAIFPFDTATVVGCDKCNSLFHRICWTKKGQICCPKCVRVQTRVEVGAQGGIGEESMREDSLE